MRDLAWLVRLRNGVLGWVPVFVVGLAPRVIRIGGSRATLQAAFWWLAVTQAEGLCFVRATLQAAGNCGGGHN